MEIVSQSNMKGVILGVVGALLFAVLRGRLDFFDDLVTKLEG